MIQFIINITLTIIMIKTEINNICNFKYLSILNTQNGIEFRNNIFTDIEILEQHKTDINFNQLKDLSINCNDNKTFSKWIDVDNNVTINANITGNNFYINIFFIFK